MIGVSVSRLRQYSFVYYNVDFVKAYYFWGQPYRPILADQRLTDLPKYKT